MSTIDYLLFAEGISANVITQGEYLAAPWRLTGFEPGIADAAQANKVWRQASFIATAIATFVSQQAGVNVLDDGNLSGFIANLLAAVAGTPRNARIVTSSATLNLSGFDYAIGLNRVVAPAAMTINLPPAPVAGQEIVIEDFAGNLFGAPATVVPSAGQINGRPNYVMAENNQSATFRFYGTFWTVST